MHLSFEYFPPKTASGLKSLLEITEQLNAFDPEFFSVTYGAGGSEQNKTLDTVTALQQHCDVATAAHITCIGSSKEKIRMLLKQYQRSNVRRLVALRGDLPSGMMSLTYDFKHAYQLIEFIRQETGDYFFIEAAAYPEMHPENEDPRLNLEHMKIKQEAGADRFITQYFYNSDAYFHLRDSASRHGIHIPIIPGIMPITNYKQLARFSTMCGAQIPRWIHMQLKTIEADTTAITNFGVNFLSRFCQQLLAGGAPGLHFYTLNKATACLKIIDKLYSSDLVLA